MKLSILFRDVKIKLSRYRLPRIRGRAGLSLSRSKRRKRADLFAASQNTHYSLAKCRQALDFSIGIEERSKNIGVFPGEVRILSVVDVQDLNEAREPKFGNMTRKTGAKAVKARQLARAAKLAQYKRALAEAGEKLAMPKPPHEAVREKETELKELYLELLKKKQPEGTQGT